MIAVITPDHLIALRAIAKFETPKLLDLAAICEAGLATYVRTVEQNMFDDDEIEGGFYSPTDEGRALLSVSPLDRDWRDDGETCGWIDRFGKLWTAPVGGSVIDRDSDPLDGAVASW